MSLFMIRAGLHGEFESEFIKTNRIYFQFEEFDGVNIQELGEYSEIKNYLFNKIPDAKKMRKINYAAQTNIFVHKMSINDTVVLPFRTMPSIAVGRIISDYQFNPAGDLCHQHYREVEWINPEIPRTKLSSDLLYSFGAYLTVCQVKKNDAENRINQLLDSDSKIIENTEETEVEDEPKDYETLLLDEIYRFVGNNFKGHKMEWLVEGILQAQGYTTWRTGEGPDGGVDILAAPGDLGFAEPRICVQVKSQDTPLERATLDQLKGVMNGIGATHGLLVCWGGFKSTVLQEVPRNFFGIRLWDKQELVRQILKSYTKLNEDLKAEIPLKQVWMLTESHD